MRKSHWWRWLFLGVISTGVILPLTWTVLASLGVQVNNTISPPSRSLPASFDGYLEIHSEQTFFWQEFATSILLSALTTLTTVAVSFLAAYSLARTRFRWRRLVVQGCLVLASLPAVSFVFPLSDILRAFRLHDTFIGVLLAECAVFAPLAAYILHGYISQIPTEWEEAAYLDGAALMQVLRDAVLPAVSPGVIATIVVVFVLSWNQFYLPVILTAIRIRVIPVMMRDFFTLEREFDWRVASAVLIISLLPVSILVAAAHRVMDRFVFAPLNDAG
jgi:multiple sugar transport system permease protein